MGTRIYEKVWYGLCRLCNQEADCQKERILVSGRDFSKWDCKLAISNLDFCKMGFKEIRYN